MSFGSWQILTCPLLFRQYARLLTQSVGSSIFFNDPVFFSILSSSLFNSSFWGIGHFRGACITGVTVGSRTMWYLPGKWPMRSNCFGYSHSRSFMDSICFASFISQCRVTILRLRYLGILNIATPFVSTMKNFSADHVSWLYLHWSLMVPICGIMVLLYVVKIVFDCLNKFFGGLGHICSYNRSGNMFPFVPVSTLTISLAVFKKFVWVS